MILRNAKQADCIIAVGLQVTQY